MFKLILKWMPLIAFVCVAVILTIVGLSDLGRLPSWISVLYEYPGGDKLGHFLLSGALALVVELALATLPVRLGHRLWPTGSILVAIGITLEEISQIFLARRDFDLLDLGAGLLGIALAAWLSLKIIRSKEQSNP